MDVTVLTLFPELFDSFLSTSLVGKAIANKHLNVDLKNYREFTHDKHRAVDDRPYGGGPGMTLKCQPLFDAVEHVQSSKPGRLIMLTPQGTPFTQKIAHEFSQEPHLIMMAGRYEGFDERIRLGLKPTEISIGDYVMMGGELPAMVIIEAVSRLIPSVLGKDHSANEESFSNASLEYPQYTRPPVFRNMRVPQVLQNGDHKAINAWREKQALIKTQQRRPDLLKQLAHTLPLKNNHKEEAT